MNLKIKNQIELIHHSEIVQLFFGLLKSLIVSENLAQNDKRLAFSSSERISVNINRRLVLMLNPNALALMINDEEMEKIPEIPFLKKEAFKNQTPATLVYFKYEDIIDNLEILQLMWLKSCHDYLPLQTNSPYRNHHIDELYNIATNDDLLETYLNTQWEENIGDKEREIKNNEIFNSDTIMKYFPLNQILYGPPGTGKTYNTMNKAIEMANPEFDLNQARNIIKFEYERLVNEGQIVFTTFHQSMTYEDFIEGIKPVIEEDEDGAKSVVYEVKDGIFKELCKNAHKSQFKKLEVLTEYSFDDAFDELVSEANQQIEKNEHLFLPILTNGLEQKVIGISERGNIILKPNYSDNAKEYTVSYSRAQKLQEAYPDLSKLKNIDKEFRAVIGGSNSTAYWSVINYINNKINTEKTSNSQNISLTPKSYVLIIDEINRGNVSQIFGELITLIEEDKRLGNDEAIEVTLPYSKEKFGVPANLYIIGTMNTADRSVEALDTALRRRFVFEEMPPKYGLDGLKQRLYGCSASEILETINKRIEKLLDRDHQIGHAYFINKDETTLIDSFYKNIIPLLQEYFFGDYAKIGLVLGAGFIKKIEQDSVFANFEHLDYSQFEENESYEIIDHRDNMTGFEHAIRLLMNK